MPEARLKATNEHGLELRYARSRKHNWPGCDKKLYKAGYWIGTKDHHVWVGEKDDDMTSFHSREEV